MAEVTSGWCRPRGVLHDHFYRKIGEQCACGKYDHKYINYAKMYCPLYLSPTKPDKLCMMASKYIPRGRTEDGNRTNHHD